MEKYKSRDLVPNEYKWDLTPFFKNEEEFNKCYEKASKLVSLLPSYEGCTKDASKLYTYLQKEIESYMYVEDLYAYSYLKNDEVLGIAENMSRKSKAEMLFASLSNNTSFFAPELLSLSKDDYAKLFIENPKLEEFRSQLDYIYRDKDHVLTSNEEVIISSLVNACDHYEDMASNLLNSEHNYGTVKIDSKDVEIATNNYSSLMKNRDESIRKDVYNKFNKKLDEYSVSNAMYLNSYVSMNDAISKLRHFDNSWDMKLFGTNINNKVYETLVKTTYDNLDVINRYFKLKRDVLGKDKLNLYDIPLELVNSKREYSIKDAQELVRKALAPLGSEYIEKYDRIIKNRFIDYCQYKGKCSGGYSLSTINQDSRILLSFNGNLGSVSTIAHESGHNVHHQFLNLANPPQYREQGSLVAEVVSLTNECLLSLYLMDHGESKEEKLSGISNMLGVIASNLFGAVREGKIEQDMYTEVQNGRTITKDYLDKVSYDSLKEFYGPYVELDSYAKNSWVTRSHYFMNFYLYSYAICISVATSVASRIYNGDKELLSKYYDFMKTGSDKWPCEVFKVLGIDLEDSKVYLDAINYFDSLITKFYEISK